MRKTIVVTVMNGAVHFTQPAVLQGEDYNQWFPLSTQGTELDFAELEKLMVSHRVAHNVTHIAPLRVCGNSKDYEVVYNEFVKGESESEVAALSH